MAKEVLAIKMSPQLKNSLADKAKEFDMTMSAYVRELILKDLKRKG